MSALAAVDLGATSGRVIVGHITDGVLDMRHAARFPNDPVRLGESLHWNITELYRQVLAGLATAERDAPGQIASIGIDSWAVDYGLLRNGTLLGIPHHYRDSRCATGVATVHAAVSHQMLYPRNGLQHLPFNTLYQLAADGDLLEFADTMLLIPDLLTYWATGTIAAERTNASTTGLVDAATRKWDLPLAEALGIPERLLPPLGDPGSPRGALTGAAADVVGRAIPVTAVASHDTASAVAAIPATGSDFAYISCGTWGLVGLELDRPILSEDARAANFTNEAGIDGTTRFLHNVMGLWLLTESLRHWHPEATDAQRSAILQELLSAASAVADPVVLFDVNDPIFMTPGDIPGRIREWCRQHGEPVPHSAPHLVRTIIESLAHAFADAVATASHLADHEVSVIHIVGGGSQNALLCQSIADRSGLPVFAGPVEATAIGNLLVQARALGLLATGVREVARRSTPTQRYRPNV